MKDYYTLIKPGIVYGNAITVIAGFVVASRGNIDLSLLFAALMGVSLIVASGCVFNNYIDRDIDALMERTKERVLVRKAISNTRALSYGAVIGVLGFFIVWRFTNAATLAVSALGFFVYVFLYSMWLKRTTSYGALVGSISGAVPLVAGYVAVSGRIDVGAVILFLILALWQMPHSLAIALYRMEDYKRANIPVLPLQKGVHRTKIEIVAYTVLFVTALLSLTFFGYAGGSYLFLMSVIGIGFVSLAVKGLYVKSPNNEAWARKVFLFSIVTLVLFCATLVSEGLMM